MEKTKFVKIFEEIVALDPDDNPGREVLANIQLELDHPIWEKYDDLPYYDLMATLHTVRVWKRYPDDADAEQAYYYASSLLRHNVGKAYVEALYKEEGKHFVLTTIQK
jgi:hypothetical protein